MTVYNENAVAVVRNFLWDQLTSYNLLNEKEYYADGFSKPLVPIIPAQQVPEFNNLMTDKTYIVYDFEVASYGDEWFICEEIMLFSIISSDFAKILEITNFMVDLFRRTDETAKDINLFIQPSKFKFFTFELRDVTSPAPYTEEGGKQIGQVEISYKYSRSLTNTRFN